MKAIILDFLFTISLGIVFAIFVNFVEVYSNKKRIRTRDLIRRVAFACYLLGLFSITVFSRNKQHLLFTAEILRWEKCLVLLLWQIIRSFLILIISGEWPGVYYADYYLATINEGIANIVLFIPLGYFVFSLHRIRNLKWKLVFVIGALCSLAIELTQLVCNRGTFDLDDIINNAMGFFCGSWYLLSLQKRSKGVSNQYVI